MNKLYNTTNIFNLYYVEIDNNCKKHHIKTFSKEWWKTMWKLKPKFKLRIETY